jgi:hypothetical protein
MFLFAVAETPSKQLTLTSATALPSPITKEFIFAVFPAFISAVKLPDLCFPRKMILPSKKNSNCYFQLRWRILFGQELRETSTEDSIRSIVFLRNCLSAMVT